MYGRLVGPLVGNVSGRLVGSGTSSLRARVIAALFGSGEQGALYDPSDLSTLFQDAAGTTPVTADGEPVGKMLDLSGNGNHATQATAGLRPLYDLTGVIHSIVHDLVDDALAVTLPDLGVDATVKYVTSGGITTLTNQTISGSYTLPQDDWHGLIVYEGPMTSEQSDLADQWLNEKASPVNDFVFTVATTGASETFTIPCQNVGTFDAVVNWGDGSKSTITTYNDADLAHVYADAGDHQIRISGTFPSIYFNNAGDKLKLKSVENLGVVGWTRLNNAFYGCSNMTSFVSGNTDTAAVTTLAHTFHTCSGMTTPPDVSGWNTAAVTSLYATFQGCSGMTTPPDVSLWDTSAVTTLANTFVNCSGMTTTPDVSLWDTSAVTTLNQTFQNCSGMTTPPDVSGWNTAAVTNMSQTFIGCSGIIGDVDISGWTITSVTVGTDFLSGANGALSTSEYDATLIAWEAQAEQPNVQIHFGDATYTAGGAAEAARDALVANGWTITDGGPA